MTNQELAMFPLGMVVFPHQTVGLCVFEPRYHQLLADVETEQRFGTCLIERGSDVGGQDQRTFVGTIVEILGSHHLTNGQTLIVVEGMECFQVGEWLVDDPYPRARVEDRCCDDVPIEPSLLKSTESAVRALRNLQSEVFADQCLQSNCAMDEDPKVRSWQLCALTPMSILDQFKVLSLSNPNDRLRLVAEICCERYGDYQRMLAVDEQRAPLT
ncbi:MAG TPA: LON peptidase substrate-binding domain-containing protein [Acidimicrobiales bacterium]|nr:LON peptidase substrate-binding domain-containing protein [Acidimicrobiales bacterium]